MIRANILKGDGIDLNDLVKLLMPLRNQKNIVFLDRIFCSEEVLRNKIQNDLYTTSFINVQGMKNSMGITNESINTSDLTQKKLYIFTNYYHSQRQKLIDFMEKVKDNCAPVFIVLTETPEK